MLLFGHMHDQANGARDEKNARCYLGSDAERRQKRSDSTIDIEAKLLTFLCG